ncbi:squalene/phytoene synthase family protein [Magnetovibrio sp.]|uniref:squalene/phytoene synthase family protein n=1 Tax=Magnetovibrio sp. TaxID=2024836 RepID=UPI002F92064B
MPPSDFSVLELSRQDRERYLCALAAPHDKRAGLMALIAFNQELARIGQTASEPMLGKIKLQWWIDVVPGILQGRPPSHPVARALAETGGALQDPSKSLRALIEARNFDLEPEKPASLNELRAYAYATSGALHGLMLDVLGITDDAVLTIARDVGAAWALIGVMRALPYRTAHRRDMLPADTTVREVLECAQRMLSDARQNTVPKAALPAVLVGRLADRHLSRLQKQNWDPALIEEPPAGVGAVASIWLGKLSGRY